MGGFVSSFLPSLNPRSYVNSFMNTDFAGMSYPQGYNYGNIPMDTGPGPTVDAQGNTTYTYSDGTTHTIRPDGSDINSPYHPRVPLNTNIGVSPGWMVPIVKPTTSPTQNQFDWSGNGYTVSPSAPAEVKAQWAQQQAQKAQPPNVSIGFGPAPIVQAPAPAPKPAVTAPKPAVTAPKPAPKPSPFAAVTTTAPKAAPAPAPKPAPKTVISNQYTRTRTR